MKFKLMASAEPVFVIVIGKVGSPAVFVIDEGETDKVVNNGGGVGNTFTVTGVGETVLSAKILKEVVPTAIGVTVTKHVSFFARVAGHALVSTDTILGLGVVALMLCASARPVFWTVMMPDGPLSIRFRGFGATDRLVVVGASELSTLIPNAWQLCAQNFVGVPLSHVNTRSV